MNKELEKFVSQAMIRSAYSTPLYSFVSQPRDKKLSEHVKKYYKERDDKLKSLEKLEDK